MSEPRRHALMPAADSRVEIVTERFIPDELASIDDAWVTLEGLRQQLKWDEALNMAVIPVEERGSSTTQSVRIFAAHATTTSLVRLEPRLSFDDVPEEQRARNKSVYGTGLYVANRAEASLNVEAQRTGKTIGAFLSDPVERSRIIDQRRSNVAREVAHLVAMVGTEMVEPRIKGKERTARKYADRANAMWSKAGAQAVLLNEAPRRRLEKWQYESQWLYDVVPPQYALLRVPMNRIGSFEYPREEARKRNSLAMYGKLFWQAAIRNARDMRHIGVPHDFTSTG